jgi:Cft2 family RNA processing exonuclease
VLESLRRGGNRNYEGFTFSSSSKQKLMEGLAVAIQQRRVRVPEGVIVTELETFEFSYHANGVRYSAPPGMHDDCVCALALVVQLTSAPVVRVGAIVI